MIPARVPLRTALESPDSKSRYVRRLFSTIADRYDLITALLSFGLDRRWKQRLVALAAVRRGTRALDLACGTGDIAFAMAAEGATVTGLDITHRMLVLAHRKHPASAKATAGKPTWVTGDMMALPFPDHSFDVVTTGYGLRNVPAITTSLAEIHRVLRPGGQLLSLDFDRPGHPLVRFVYLAYLTVVGSALGLVLHGDPDTYRYIPESIRRYPGARGVVALMEAQGFDHVRWLRVLGGFMAIHAARK
ncbi:MAG TPA: ubiquinone/menaquinone biosynthesis methyltransferase [Vicinamibacterales bacterium]|nr:ubiquinone/menaquinone biosynthesis methyltransferase [Vicinamibacterales bacterium]